MTIASTARKAGPLLGNGSTTSFSFSFKVFATSDIKVAIANSAGVETVLVENTHYTVSLNANQETSPGGAITYPISGSPLPSGSVLSIIGDLDYDQPLDLPSGGNFNPTALENQLDRATMQIQQLKEQVDRSAKLPQTSQADADELSANLMRLAGSADNIDTVATGIAAVNTVADDLNEPVSEINTVAGSIGNVNAVGTDIANVNAVAGNIASVNAVAGNATNINAVNANKTNIDAVAGNATNINAVVANLADIQNAPENAALVVDAIAQAVDGEKQLFLAGTNYTKGVTTQLTLTYTPAKSGTVSVIFDGIEQHLTEWSLADKVITFAAAIPADKVEVHYHVPSQFVGLSGADLTVLGSAQSAAQAGAAVATSAAASAVLAKTAAEAARDATVVGAAPTVYATTAAGLAATTSGQYFSVPSADSAEYLILYQNSSGSAVEVKRYPSSGALFSSETVNDYKGSYELVDPPNLTTGNKVYVFSSPVDGDGTVNEVQLFAKAAGNLRVSVWSRSGSTLTRVQSQEVAIVVGLQTIAISVPVVSGQYIGFSTSGNCNGHTTTTGVAKYWATAGTYAATTTTVPGSESSATIQIRIKSTLTRASSKLAKRDGRIPFEKLFFLGSGQSNMEGGDGGWVTTAQEYDNSCLPAYYSTKPLYATVVPAYVLNMGYASGTRDESPMFGAAKAVRDALLKQNNIAYTDVASTVIITSNARGGTGIADLSKGTERYNWAIGRASYLKDIYGSKAGALAVAWVHGEEDASLGVPGDTYKALLKQLASDYDADLRAAFAQSKSVPLVCSQVAQTYSSISYRYLGVSQWQAAAESDLVVMACPTYMFTYTDALHVSAAHSRVLGGYLGLAAKQTAIDGRKFEPLQPVHSTISGNSIIVTFNKRGLVFDTTTIAAQTNSGFAVENASGVSQTVSSVEIINGNQVRITTASTPAAGWKVKYGVPATSRTPFTGSCGNLRDNAGTSLAIDGWPLHNWCVLFDWSV